MRRLRLPPLTPAVAIATHIPSPEIGRRWRQRRSDGYRRSGVAFGLLKNGLVEPDGERITVLQGRPMDCLSEIGVRLGNADDRPIGCLLAGIVSLARSKEC